MKRKELSSSINKKHHKPTPGKQVMIDACNELKIDAKGSIKEMYQRIKHFYKEEGHGTPCKKKRSGSVLTKHSSEKDPLKMGAKEYVEKFCKGDVDKAKPEWVNTGKRAKLMKAKVTGSKVGKIVRWVKARI